MRRPQLTEGTGSMKSSIIEVDVVAAVVKESIVAVTVVAVALGGIVERGEDVAAEAIGEIAVEEKVVNVVVAVDVVDSEAIVGVVTGPNRQVAPTPHYLSHWLLCVPGPSAYLMLLSMMKNQKSRRS